MSGPCSVGPGEIGEISFYFEAPKKPLTARIGRTAGEELETCVEMAGGYRTCTPYRDTSRPELIRRYFTIGDSNLNYSAALATTLELHRLSA